VKVGRLSRAQVRAIAETKLEDLNARFPGRYEPAELLLEMARRRQVFYPDERS